MYVLYYTVIYSELQEVFLMIVSKYKIFLKVVELGSLTKAAQQLGYTQSAVSHAINALEGEINLRLITRNRAGVRLTQDGERLLPLAKKIVEATDEFGEAVNAIHGLEAGSVRIGAFTSVAVHWLPSMIKQYQEQHPNIELSMLTGDYHDISQWFADGSIDAGFVTKKTSIEGCEYIPLCEDKLLAVMPKNHRLSGKRIISAADLAGEPFISLLENSAQDARGVLEDAGIKVDVRFTTKDDYAIIAMVEQGLGVSIMPELLLEGHSDGICVAEIEGGKKRSIGLAVSSAGASSPSVQSFAQFVRQWVSGKYGAASDCEQ